MAKALEQTDGVRYHADLESRRHRVVQLSQQPITRISAKTTTEEWTIVKKTRSTLKERIQKRRAKAANAHALSQQRREKRKEMVTKESPKLRQVWIPKSGLMQSQHSEPVKTPYPQMGGFRRATPNITLDRSKTKINCPENTNKVLYPQKKTNSPNDIVIPGRSCQQTIRFFGNHTDESYYQVRVVNNFRKRVIREINSRCSCARLVKAALSECDCFKREAFPRRVSVSSKPKPRHFRKRKSVAQDDEFPKVTINVADKRKSKRHSSDSNPDFFPGGRVNPRIAQRMSRL